MAQSTKRSVKSRILGGFALAAIALGTVGGGTIATAAPAEAASFGSWSCSWVGWTGGNRYLCKSWVNYNWYEEIVLGKDDRYAHKLSYWNISGQRNTGIGW